MAIVKDREANTERTVDLFTWIRNHRYDITSVAVVEDEADGGAVVCLQMDNGQSVTEKWGSYENAKEYFGPRKGWRGTRMLQHTPKRFINKHGEIEYSTFGVQ